MWFADVVRTVGEGSSRVRFIVSFTCCGCFLFIPFATLVPFSPFVDGILAFSCVLLR